MNRGQLLQIASGIAFMGLAFAGVAHTQQPNAAQQTKQNAKQQSSATHTSAQKESEGQRIFTQNCARCHTPPDGFSPRISGSIVLHMRVRASLSEHDQQELLRFFNP
jgi:cytochrome c5